MFDNYSDVLTVDELCQALRIGQNKAYELLKDKAISHVRVGRKYLIPKQSLLTYLGIGHCDFPANPLE